MTVLVAYASRMGSTEEIAQTIGKHLRDAGLAVDVRPCDRAPDAWKYQAVVLGSAVYLGRWEPAAVDYLHAQAPDLAERPTWLFQSGPCGAGAETDQITVPRKVRHLVDEIGIADPVTFGGRLDRQRATGRVARWMATGTYAGDFRDWARIGRWSIEIARALQDGASVSVPPASVDTPLPQLV